MRHPGYALIAVLGLASVASLAQDAEPVGVAEPAEMEPAVDTSAADAEPVADTSAAPAASSGTMDVLQLERTSIIGNRELPKVLYIVPWKDPDGMLGIELEPEFTELQVFRRLYPPAYRRELNYYELLNAVETEE